MGKRSDFERIPRDLYKTPFRAALPLRSYLQRADVKTFAEYCVGEGDLKRHVESFGLTCTYAGDIKDGQDALKLTVADLNGAQIGITDPPYKYPEDPERTTRLLRDLIEHSLGLGIPFWFLIYSDWMLNRNAAPFLPYCTNIVTVGRVKWIEGTKSSGKDNCAWYRFDINHRGDTAFHNDRNTPLNTSSAMTRDTATDTRKGTSNEFYL